MPNQRSCFYFCIFTSKQRNNSAVLAYLKKIARFFEGAGTVPSSGSVDQSWRSDVR